MASNSLETKLSSAERSLRNSSRRASSVDRTRSLFSSTSLLGVASCALASAGSSSAATNSSRAMGLRLVMGVVFMGSLSGGGGRVLAVAAAAEHVFADHLHQVHGRRGVGALVARLQRLDVAAGLQPDVAFAEQAAGEDAGRGVG